MSILSVVCKVDLYASVCKIGGIGCVFPCSYTVVARLVVSALRIIHSAVAEFKCCCREFSIIIGHVFGGNRVLGSIGTVVPAEECYVSVDNIVALTVKYGQRIAYRKTFMLRHAVYMKSGVDNNIKQFIIHIEHAVFCGNLIP